MVRSSKAATRPTTTAPLPDRRTPRNAGRWSARPGRVPGRFRVICAHASGPPRQARPPAAVLEWAPQVSPRTARRGCWMSMRQIALTGTLLAIVFLAHAAGRFTQVGGAQFAASIGVYTLMAMLLAPQLGWGALAG